MNATHAMFDEMTFQEARQIVSDFGAFLEGKNRTLFDYEDVLPHSRDKITSAILKLLELPTDEFSVITQTMHKSEKDARSALTAGLAWLSYFIPTEIEYQKMVLVVETLKEKKD